MKKYIVLLMIILMASVCSATLTYDGTYYLKNQSTQYSGSTRNAIYLALEEIESDLDAIVAGTGTTLDAAYNSGSSIDVDTDAVTLTVSDTDNNVALAIVQNDSTNDPDAMSITSAADAATAVGLQFACTAGYDIQGTSDTWNISIAGAAILVGITSTGEFDQSADVLFDSTYDVAWDENRNQMIWQDNAVLGLGGAHDAAADVTLTWNGTNLLIEAATQDTGKILLGSTNSMDFNIYGNTATDIASFDSGAGALLLDSYPVALGDGDAILFGDPLGTGDFSISDQSDVLTITQIVDGTGSVAFSADGEGMDVKFHGDTASSYMLWDENGNTNGALLFDAADIMLGDGDLIIFGDSSDITLGYDGTGNDLELTEGNGAAILSLIGFEANEGQLHILADQDDDATDGWEIASSTTGTLTIGNDSAVAGTFVDKLTIAGSTGNVTLTGDIINENADILVMSTDDKLSFQSNDEYSTFQALGFEAKEATLELLADQDDDATDGWEIASSVTGTLTIGNDSAVAGTFVDKLTIAGSTGNVTLTGDIINENGDSLLMNTDDTLVYTSDDTNATFQVMGFEASTAILSLAADEADDAGDSWTFTVADAGALTIANDGTATMTIQEVVAMTSDFVVDNQTTADADFWFDASADGGNGTVYLGKDDKGIDFVLYGETANKLVNWDMSANTLYVGADDQEVDMKWYGAEASDYMMWDGDLNTYGALVFEDSTLNMMDDTAINFGDNQEVNMYYDEAGDNDLKIKGPVSVETTYCQFNTIPMFSAWEPAATGFTWGGAATGATGDENVMMFPQATFIYHILGAGQTELGPQMRAGGFDISMDDTDDEGVEIDGAEPIVGGCKDNFTVGTDAFYLKAKVYFTNISGTDDFWVGFRKVEAFQAGINGYDTYALIGVNSNAGDIYTATELNGGGETETDVTVTGGDLGDTEAHTFEVYVSAAKAVTYKIDGETPTGVAAFTWTDADVVVPIIYLLHANADQANLTYLQSWECGLQ